MEILGKKFGVPERETPKQGDLFWCNSLWRVAQEHTPMFWVFRVYLTIFKPSRPLKTSIELDWTWFCESYLKLFENGLRTRIFQKLVFSKKKGRTRVVYCSYDL